MESSVAEKLEAIVRNGYLNSRYKDFYDIYIISTTYSFSYTVLRSAVVETFENRKTNITVDTAAFTEDFINDPMHQSRWKSFLKKKKALVDVSLTEAISKIKAFSTPLLKEDQVSKWDHKAGLWK